MKVPRIHPELLVFVFLGIIILWKGGKTLDAVWLQAILAGFVIFFSHTVRFRSVHPAFLVSLAGLFFCTVISFLMSTTQNYGFDEVLQSGSLTLLAVFAAARHEQDKRFAGRFAQIVSFAGLIACAVGTAVYILQPVSRFVGTFFNYRFHTDYWPNAWAEFLLFLWPLLLWVIFTRKESTLPPILRRDWLRGAVLGFVLSCLLLSYSRGGFIAFSGQIVLLLLLTAALYRRIIAWKRVMITALVTAVTAVVLFTATNALRDSFHEVQSVVSKVTFSSDEGKSSVFERRAFWRQAMTMTSLKPLFGWGPYSFRFIQPHFQDGVLQTSDHPHNVFLKYAAERGIPAALFLLFIVVFALAQGMRIILHAADEVPLQLFLVIAVAGVLAHNLIDYNLQFVGIALPLWLAIGVLVSRPSPRRSASPRRTLEVTLAGILLLFTLFEGVNLTISSFARKQESSGTPFEALSLYAFTDYSLFPRDGWLARSTMLLALHQLPEAEQALDRSLAYNEQDGRAWRLLGDIYLRWNKRQDALRAYEKAYKFARYDDIGITRGLVYLLKDQDSDELRMRRHEFDVLLNEFGLAIEENTHFIALSRNVEDLVALCDILAETFPADADAYRQLARRSQNHANEERAKTSSRPRGLLW